MRNSKRVDAMDSINQNQNDVNVLSSILGTKFITRSVTQCWGTHMINITLFPRERIIAKALVVQVSCRFRGFWSSVCIFVEHHRLKYIYDIDMHVSIHNDLQGAANFRSQLYYQLPHFCLLLSCLLPVNARPNIGWDAMETVTLDARTIRKMSRNPTEAA